MTEYRKEIQRKLEHLHPGENSKEKYHEYCLRQKRLVSMLLLLGFITSVFVSLWNQTDKVRKSIKAGELLRREWGEGNYEVTLLAEVGKEKERITYMVEERQFTEEELRLMLDELTKKLPQIIKGKNKTLSRVSEDLELPRQVQDYPFVINWKSSNNRLLSTGGKVSTEELSTETEEVILTALLVYEEQCFQRKFPIRIYEKEKSAETQRAKQLLELVNQNDEKSKQNTRILLPKQLGESVIDWKQIVPWQGGYLLLWAILGAIGIIFGMNYDLTKKDRERKDELISGYPEFVSSLQLYLGAGLSLRNAFYKIGEDYRKQKQKNGNMQFLYEEITLACNMLVNGLPEWEVYRRWAERCDEAHYRKLGYLFISYGRQGNADILNRLEGEVFEAWEEKRRMFRKAGEEAGTKLLFPMVLMLLVVMFLILLPVYMSF